MAIDVCSEITSSGISPRISFSQDLKNSDDAVPVEGHHRASELCLLDSTSDFVFCITNGLPHQLSSADELFSNGKIVPTEIKRVSNAPDETHQPAKPAPSVSGASSTRSTEKKRLKELLSAALDAENEEELEKPASKYFWQFKRSSSLNCDTTRGKGLIRSLQFLSRSNSTGSAPNPKQTVVSRETQKQRLQKQSSISSRRLSSSSTASSSTYYFYDSSQKPSLKKSCGSSSGYGVRISPVLNLPQAYIPKATVSFFGFGSLFCNGIGKIKKKKK